jgi:hypothetical protein
MVRANRALSNRLGTHRSRRDVALRYAGYRAGGDASKACYHQNMTGPDCAATTIDDGNALGAGAVPSPRFAASTGLYRQAYLTPGPIDDTELAAVQQFT